MMVRNRFNKNKDKRSLDFGPMDQPCSGTIPINRRAIQKFPSSRAISSTAVRGLKPMGRLLCWPPIFFRSFLQSSGQSKDTAHRSGRAQAHLHAIYGPFFSMYFLYSRSIESLDRMSHAIIVAGKLEKMGGKTMKRKRKGIRDFCRPIFLQLPDNYFIILREAVPGGIFFSFLFLVPARIIASLRP